MRNIQILFVVTMNFKYSVCYNRETLLGKHAKPNQLTQYVRNNQIFVKIEFCCSKRATTFALGQKLVAIVKR